MPFGRSARVAANYVVVLLTADMFAVQGLENIGPKLRQWRRDWQHRLLREPPTSEMQPWGYVMSRYGDLLGGPIGASRKWLDRAPRIYQAAVLGADNRTATASSFDPNRLATLKDYRSLMPMARESRKPMFLPRPGDGAVGECYAELANVILRAVAARAHDAFSR